MTMTKTEKNNTKKRNIRKLQTSRVVVIIIFRVCNAIHFVNPFFSEGRRKSK